MFFFFDFTGDFVNPLGLSEKERESALERLNKETNAQGLRNVELADLTGWSTSKVSKVASGKQKLTDDDIRIWARALGYTPSAFLEPDFDMRSFKIMDHVRSVVDCISAYLNSDEGTPEHDAIMNYEIPLSILGTLGLKAADYCIRTHHCQSVKDPFAGTTRREVGYIRMWSRGTVSKDESYPELMIWMSPTDNSFAIILYLNRNDADVVLSNLCQTYKDTLKIDGEDHKRFETFARENKACLSRKIVEGEISAYTHSAGDALPDDNLMLQILVELLSDYYELVWQMKGMDLKPKHFKEQDDEEFTAFEQYRIMTGNAQFDSLVEEEILRANRCQCEMNPDHKTFTKQNGSQYMEAIPLIPFGYAGQYGKGIMGVANGLCVCPICRAKLAHGRNEDREEMLMTLYLKHRKALKEANIQVTLSELLHMYGL